MVEWIPLQLVSGQLVLGVLVSYLLVLVGIGVYSYRQGSFASLEDFFVVSRSLGVSVMVFTVLATLLSTFFYLGIAATFLGNGIGWIAIASWQIMTALGILYGGSRIWKLGNHFDYITPSEMYSEYYNSNLINILLPAIYTIASLPFFILQMRGSGLALDGVTGGAIPFEVGVTIFLVISVLYLLAGGARAVAITDLFQGVVFSLILGIFFFLVVSRLGPAEIGQPVFRSIAQSQPANLTWPGAAGVFGGVTTFSLLIGAGIGNLCQGPIFQYLLQ